MQDTRPTPDHLAKQATLWSLAGRENTAATYAQSSIRSRASWVLINGRWTPRQNILRRD